MRLSSRSTLCAYAAALAVSLSGFTSSFLASAAEPVVGSSSTLSLPPIGSAAPSIALTLAQPPVAEPSAVQAQPVAASPPQVWPPSTVTQPLYAPVPASSGYIHRDSTGSDPEAKPSQWYGWQPLLLDLAAIGLLSKSPEASVGLYAVGGPTVHAVHGNGVRAGASFAFRLGLPILGAIVGSATDNCEQTEYERGKDINHCTIPISVIGLGAGALIAMVLDATVLSYVPGTESKATETPANKTHREPDRQRVREADSGVRFSGGVSVTPQRSEVVITGVF